MKLNKLLALTIGAVLGASVAVFALLTSRANAEMITHGNLTSDTTSKTIIDTQTGVEYLRFDVLADLTYAQTVNQVEYGGTYYGWHIASQKEAFAFMNSALVGSGYAFVDNSGQTNESLPLLAYQDGDFGANHTSDKDSFWFLAEEGREVGWAVFTPFGGNNISINDAWNDIAASDSYATNGDFLDQPVSWLLVKNEAVPEPTSLALFGVGALGLAGVRMRSKRKRSA